MTLPDPTPEEMIISLGLSTATDIDKALLDACLDAMDTKESPQDFRTAFNCLRAVLMRHWDNPDPAVQKHVAEALQRRAQILVMFDRLDEARGDFEEVWMRYEGSEDPEIRNSVAIACHEAGKLEERVGNLQAAEKWHALTERYIDSTNSSVLYSIAVSQNILGELLAERGELARALGVFDKAIERWTTHADYWVRRAIANLRADKATAVMNNGDRASALELYDEAISYADCLADPPAYFPQMTARLGKCICLEKMTRYRDVIAAVTETERWAGDVARAGRGYTGENRRQVESLCRRMAILKARCLREIGDLPAALAAFDQAGLTAADIESCAENSRQIIDDVSLRAVILYDMGREEEARDYFFSITQRLREFGRISEWDFSIVEIFAQVGNYLEIAGPRIDLTTPADGSPDPS